MHLLMTKIKFEFLGEVAILAVGNLLKEGM